MRDRKLLPESQQKKSRGSVVGHALALRTHALPCQLRLNSISPTHLPILRPPCSKKCSTHPEHGPVYKKHASMKSDVFHLSQPIDYSPCTNVRLPSLAQIHAKMGSPARQQSASGMGAVRMDSSESIEILQTPTEEYTSSRIEARLALSTVLHRRPSTPSSSVTMPAVSSPKEKEAPRLAPFCVNAPMVAYLAGLPPCLQ